MAKKKNLTKQDIEDVSTFETYLPPKTNGHNGISINDISIKIKCLNEKQKLLKNTIEEKEIILVNGPSGVGKTYLSLLMALHLLKTQPKYRQITLVKSVQTITGEGIGYLPGDINDKIFPYMYSFVGNLNKIFRDKETSKKLIEKGIIEFLPIAYIRGINVDSQICIIDETQNIDPHTFKTIITRIGNDSKFIFLGDTEQIDRKIRDESCFSRICEMFKDSEFVSVINFTDDDCVRNPIIPKILDVLTKNNL
jgi:phosphate starvation-inducible PhoH-like protein